MSENTVDSDSNNGKEAPGISVKDPREEEERRRRRERLLDALESIMMAPPPQEPRRLLPPPPPPLHEQQQQKEQSAPPSQVQTQDQRVHVQKVTPPSKWFAWLGNVVSMLVFAAAILLYVSPELFIHVGSSASSLTAAAATMGPEKSEFHPEWPLHTFDTFPKSRVTPVAKAVVSDTRLYDQVIETLSYHLLREQGKRVLCMWHLRLPPNQRVSNVCVWKRRPDHKSVFSLRLVTPTVDEGVFLPMYNLDIKGQFLSLFCLCVWLTNIKTGYSTNATKVVSETSLVCGRSRLMARKRRQTIDITLETVKHWTAVRLLVDDPGDEASAFALQQAWEESRGYKCEHEF